MEFQNFGVGPPDLLSASAAQLLYRHVLVFRACPMSHPRYDFTNFDQTKLNLTKPNDIQTHQTQNQTKFK